MPPEGLDDKEKELASSTNSTTLDGAAEGKTPVEAPAKSSSANDVVDTDTLSVVREVVANSVDGKKAATTGSSPDGEEAGEVAGGSATPKEADRENYTDVPFHKHPRFRELLSERNTYKTDAVRYQNVETFLGKNGLTGDEAFGALQIFGLAKTDATKAWPAIRPWVQDLLVRAGEVLPADLAERVQKGELTQPVAFEVSKARAAEQSLRNRTEWERQQATQTQAVEADAALRNAAGAWLQDRHAKDPGFEAKIEPIRKEIAYLHVVEGKPTTPEGVREQLAKAYKAVNAALPAKTAAVRTASRAVSVIPVNGHVADTVRPAKAKSTLDIIRANRRQPAVARA